MQRLSCLLATLFAAPAWAHEGLHHHPHGIESAWPVAALIGAGVGGGLVWALKRTRK